MEKNVFQQFTKLACHLIPLTISRSRARAIACPRELVPRAESEISMPYPARRMHPLPRAKGRSIDDGLVIMTADGTEFHAPAD